MDCTSARRATAQPCESSRSRSMTRNWMPWSQSSATNATTNTARFNRRWQRSWRNSPPNAIQVARHIPSLRSPTSGFDGSTIGLGAFAPATTSKLAVPKALLPRSRRGRADLCAYVAHLAVNAPDGSYDESAGVLTFAGGPAYPGTYTNGVIRKGDDANADTVLERARAFFRPLRRGYAIWVRDHADSD